MPDTMSYNAFQRELTKRGVEGNTAYMFALVYERLIHTEEQVVQMAELCVKFAEQLQGFLQLREEDVRKIDEMQKKLKGGFQGIHLGSVPNEPE